MIRHVKSIEVDVLGFGSRLWTALETLPDRERVILCSRFGLGTDATTLAETGEMMGLSPERIRQIEARAMGRIRDYAYRLEWSHNAWRCNHGMGS